MTSSHARPARPGDEPAIAALLQATGQGPDRVALPASPALRLVVEDGSGQLLATAQLLPAIGLVQPRLWYAVGCVVHAAAELQLYQRQRTLLLGHDHTGASELNDIAWQHNALPLATQARVLQQLLRAALLHLGRERGAFADSLIVELPGPRDAAGQSPFWQGLGRHFYAGDPATARAAHGPAWRSLVAALLPRQQVYASFLPTAAQAAIGQVQADALVLREVLHDIGLRYSHHVNLEDGGPVLEGDTDTLVAQAR